MKRKVIQVAESTHLISLPRKWTLQHKIKKGDELDVLERPNQLIITAGAPADSESAEIDVTGLDRTSIILLIRGLYKRGFDEIKIICDSPTVTHFRMGAAKTFLHVVHNEVNRLPGMEVIEQKDNYCLIKALSEPSLKDIESVMRRLLHMINDAADDVMKSARNYDEVLLDTIEEKHDSIHKFTAYSMRLLNKSSAENRMFLFAQVCLLDKVMDCVKNASRLMMMYKKRLHPESIALLDLIFQTYSGYQKIHFKLDFDMISQISRQKEEARDRMVAITKKIPKEEILIVESLHSSLELFRHTIELRLACVDVSPSPPQAGRTAL